MAATPARKRPATYADLEGVPSHLVTEILAGELHATPRPSFLHARASSALGALFFDPFDLGRGGPGGWWILDEPELHFGDEVVVPDLAGWRRERLLSIPSSPWISLAPDWVCEVISPSTERMDRVLKLPLYAREGVSNLWLVNPDARTLEVYRRADKAWTLLATHGGDEIVRAEPFDAVELDLLVLWGETRAPRNP